jgi:hypothetical protein
MVTDLQELFLPCFVTYAFKSHTISTRFFLPDERQQKNPPLQSGGIPTYNPVHNPGGRFLLKGRDFLSHTPAFGKI